MPSVESRLEAVFREIFIDDDLMLKNNMSAENIEDWDSLSNISLIVAIEKAFSIRFEMGEVAQLKNVGEMIEVIRTKISN